MNNNGEGTPRRRLSGSASIRVEGAVVPEAGAVLPLSASEINDLRLLAIHCRRNNAPPMVAVEDIERWLITVSDLKAGRASDRQAYQTNFDLLQRQVDELVLALMWCKPRLKQEAYQRHIEWTLAKYPKPPKVDEPRIVRSTPPLQEPSPLPVPHK